MPACEPVKLTASWPSSMIAIDSSAIEMRSPAVSSMSISRRDGSGDSSCARSISSSVVLPMAETTTQTWWPASAVSTTRRATFLIRSALPTDVPPNFWTYRAKAEKR